MYGGIMSDKQNLQIAKLEKELKEALIELEEYKAICNNFNMEVLKLQLKADKDLFDSSDYNEIMKRIKLAQSKNSKI
jgi:hypothetical protein